jgi:uncharacterized membrane protein YhaH (DUF805 family)
MIDWYKKVVFENYANFSGRARRSEYWYFVLANIILFLAVVFFISIISEFVSYDSYGAFAIVFICYILAILIPMFALICRRLHDINKSGWYYLVRLIPIIGPIWFLIMMCTEGDKGRNDYGNDPKFNYDELEEIGVENNY